ncbi:hypothetical protein [Kitasatospora sp. NPDC004289]
MSTTPVAAPPEVVIAVVVFSLIAAGLCLLLAAGWAIYEGKLVKAAADAAKAEAEVAKLKLEAAQRNVDQHGRPLSPVGAQAGPSFDFSGLGQLAAGLQKLPMSGRLLVVSLGFAAIAAVAASAGSIASAVA